MGDVIAGRDDRGVRVGPCSTMMSRWEESMRSTSKACEQVSGRSFDRDERYFEKPRTTVGWKGLINDPS